MMSRQVHAKTESEWEKALLDKNVHSAMNGPAQSPADIFSTRFKIINLYRFDTFHRRKGKTTLNVPLTSWKTDVVIMPHGPWSLSAARSELCIHALLRQDKWPLCVSKRAYIFCFKFKKG